MDNSFLHRSKLRALFRVVHRNDGNTLQYSEWQIFGHSRIYHQYFLAVHRWRRRVISRRAYHDRETRERRTKKKKKKKTKTRKSSPSVHFLHALSIPPDHFDPPCSTPVHLVTKFTKREFSIPFRVLDPRPTPKSYPPPFSSSRIIPGS